MNNKVKKLLAGVLALVMMGFIVYLYLAFKGNPVSRLMADRAIEAYIEENYKELEPRKSKTSYNFKDGNYTSRLETDYIDVHFYIGSDSWGKIVYDSYDSQVLGKINSYSRLENQYMEFIDRKIKSFENLEFGLGSLVGREEGIKNLDLNREYTIGEIGLEKTLSLYIYEERSLDRLAYWLKRIDETFSKDELDTISLVLKSRGEDPEEIWLDSFPRQLINEDLEKNIELHLKKTREREDILGEEMEKNENKSKK